MPRWRIDPKVVARKLAVQISATLEASGKRIVLVTSPNAGEGKTYLMQLIAPELERVAPHRFRLLGMTELETVNPWHVPDDRVLLVDGPAVLEGDAFLEIRKGWISAFDGALIVVMGRRTSRDDLEETVAWLSAVKIPPIGVVWNERVAPSFLNRLQLLLARLKWPRPRVPKRERRERPIAPPETRSG